MSNYARQTSSANDIFANVLYVVLAVAVGTWLIWDAAFFRLASFVPTTDYWEYTAVFAEWLQNISGPGNPHVDDPALSSRFMPYFWALTFIGLLFQLDAIDLMGLSAVINYLLIVIGIWRFTNDYFNDAWAPLAGFFAIFLLWGAAWPWEGLHELSSFFYVAGYPSTFVFGLSLISFSVVIRLMRTDDSLFIHTLLLMMLAALMFLCQPLTAVFGLVGCSLLALTEPADSRKRRTVVLMALVLGTVIAELWPYFSPWKILLGLYGEGGEAWAGFMAFDPAGRLLSGAWQSYFYDPEVVLSILGPALLGIFACLWLWRRGKRRFIVWGAVLMSIPYFLNFFFEISGAPQFLLFTVIYLQLAVVWVILAVIDAWRTEPRSALATPMLLSVLACMFVLGGFHVWALSIQFDNRSFSPLTRTVLDRSSHLPESMNVVDVYAQLTERMEYNDVVLTTAQLGWPVPTVRGKVVALHRENPMLEDQQERRAATGYFFYDRSASDASRSGIAKHYGATYVLTSSNDTRIRQDVYNWLDQHSRLTAAIGDYRMYRLMSSAYAAAPDEPQPAATPQPAVAASAPVASSSAPPVNSPVTLPAAPARSRVPDVDESDYGAPIAAPIIEPVETVFDEPPSRAAREPVDEVLPEELLAPLEERMAEPEPVQADTPPETYGAPIAEPVLDPERHGG